MNWRGWLAALQMTSCKGEHRSEDRTIPRNPGILKLESPGRNETVKKEGVRQKVSLDTAFDTEDGKKTHDSTHSQGLNDGPVQETVMIRAHYAS